MKKVSIVGATISGNKGAEAMLCTTIRRIEEKYPDSKFYIYSYSPREDKTLLSKQTNLTVFSSTPLYLVFILFPLSIIYSLFKFIFLDKLLYLCFPSSVSSLSNSDVLIDIAGVSYMDGREIFLPFNILTILPAILLGTPVVKFSQGMGTFNNFFTKIAAKIFLSKCDMIFARGELTYKYLNDFFHHKKNYRLASDVSFCFKKCDSLSSENEEYVKNVIKNIIKNKETSNNIIGICPSSIVYNKSLKNGTQYISTISYIIQKLLENDSNTILLFPNATRESSNNLRNNDLPIIKMIIEELQKKEVNISKINYITKDINTDSIKSLIEQCNITIVSRFHAMIASLSLEVPTIVLGWSHKYFEVMKQFDIEKLVYDYTQQDKNIIININEVLKNEMIYKNKIHKILPSVRKKSFTQFEYIFEKILLK